MQKTKIEWVRNPDGTQGYTWNPIKGYCPNDCPYCYAHRMYNRFKYWNKTIRLDKKGLEAPAKLKKPSRIFVGSMIDMYHPDINREWIHRLFSITKNLHHTFITLTKYPYEMIRYNFPHNWWQGITVTGDEWWDCFQPEFYYPNMTSFISFEPLLHPVKESHIKDGLDWIIMGGLTPKPIHKKEWIDDIVERADNLGIPVFIKDNAHYPIKRQEFPK